MNTNQQPRTLGLAGWMRRSLATPRRGGWAFGLALLLSLTWSAAASAVTVYVDQNNPSCSDAGPGTNPAFPYCTIDAALSDHTLPGTTVQVEAGVYEEQVTIRTSGTAAQPYILEANGLVILDGADEYSSPTDWTLHSGNVWLAAGVTSSPGQVIVGGDRLRGQSPATPALLDVGRYDYVSGQGLYVNVGGANPGDSDVFVSQIQYGIRSAGRSYVEIRGFQTQHFFDRGIYVTGPASNVLVEDNVSPWNGKNGIGMIECTNSNVRRNIVSDSGDHGIYIVDTHFSNFDDNESRYNARPAVRAANGIYMDRSADNLARRNLLHHNQDSGLNLTNSSSRNVFTNNLYYSNGDHGADHISDSFDNVHIHDVAYGNFRDGFSYEGNADGGQVFNCIGIDNGINDNHYNLWIDSDSETGFASNHNIWWNSTTQVPIKMGSNSYQFVTDWAAATGNDVNSFQVFPAFVDTAAGNFRILSGSKAIDAADATVPGWPPLDIEGRERKNDPGVPNTGVGAIDYADIGAYEFEPNLIANPSFEIDLSGWAPKRGTLARVAGGKDGDFSAELTSTQFPSTFELNDSPNWIDTTLSIGQIYRYSAWVRATVPSGDAQLRIREYENSILVGTSTNSKMMLTSDWQFLAVDHVVVADTSTLDFNIIFTPDSVGKTVQVDDITARLVSVDNPPEVFAPAAASGPEGDTLTVLVTASDPEGEPFSMTANFENLPLGHNATFIVDPGGESATFRWVPSYAAAGGGPYDVTFNATNVTTGSTVTSLTVTDVDPPPVVTAPANASGVENSEITVAITALDPDGSSIDSLTVDLGGLPAGHNAVFTADPGDTSGTLTWTPTFFDAGGPYPVIFKAWNSLMGADTTQVMVAHVDQPPTIGAPSDTSAGEGLLFTLNLTAIDHDNQPVSSFSADLTNLPAGNDAQFDVSLDQSSATFTWTPEVGTPAGPYPLILTAFNALTTVDTVFILIDRAPSVSAPATIEVGELQLLTVNVTASDPDGNPITSLTADLSNLPVGHDAVFTPAGDNLSGTLTWTPTSADGRAATYDVRFVAANALSDTTTTAITVDQPPEVSGPAAVSVGEGDPLTVDVTVLDPDGDPITGLNADLSNLPGGHNAVFTPGAGNLSGQLTWTPTFADGGAGPYIVPITASNDLDGVLSVSITVDQHPVVTAPATKAGAENVELTVNVSASDLDVEAITDLTADLSNLPLGHNAVFTPGVGNTTAVLTWTPTFDDSGSYDVLFRAENALAGSTTTTLQIANTDRAPIVVAPATIEVGENELLTLNLSFSDPDGDAITSLTPDLSSLPAGHDAAFTPGVGNTTAVLTWTPTSADGGAGPYNLTFTASNALNGQGSTLVTVDQKPVVTAPATANATENTLLNLNVTASDEDGQAIDSLTVDLSGLPAGHDAVFTTAPDNLSGTLTWTPSFLASPGPYTLHFVAHNKATGTDSTVVSINNVDRVPVLTAPAGTSAGVGQLLTINVTASDPDLEPITSLTADLTNLPAGNDAEFVVAPDKSSAVLTWTPLEADAPGSPYIVTFTATNALQTSSATAVLVDRLPLIAVPDSIEVDENALATINVHAEDPDQFDFIASLTADLSGLPAGHDGVFAADPGDTTGTFTWTPTFDDAPGPYTVYFMASNALTRIDSTVVKVNPVDRAPVVVSPDTTIATEGLATLINVTASDPEGEAITSLTADFSSLPIGHGATFTPGLGNSTGVFEWTPALIHAPGPYNVTFTAQNALSGNSVTTVTINRRPVVTAPATANAQETVALNLNVTAGDADGDAIDSLTVDLSNLPAGHDATFTPAPGNLSGVLMWTPTFEDSGSYDVTFTAWNDVSGSALTTIEVGNFDRRPIVSGQDTVLVAEAALLTTMVTVADPDSDAVASLTADLSNLPAGNDAQFTPTGDNKSGTLTWTPTLADGGVAPYPVHFIATNALADTFTVYVKVDQRPVITAPASVNAGEGDTIVVNITVADPDGEAINSLSANLGGLPAAHNAVFTPAGDNLSGTLTWVPTFFDAQGPPYLVTFTASNALSGGAVTQFFISNTDRQPVVSATSDSVAVGGVLMSIAVSASDPDGEPISSLTADLSALPNPNDAAFTPGLGNSTGVFTWTPDPSDPLGPFDLLFIASNAAAGSTSTRLTVDQAPIVSATTPVAASEGNEVSIPVTVTEPNGEAIDSLFADLSGLPAGHNAVFTPAGDKLSGTLTWTPTFGDAGGPYSVKFTAINSLIDSAVVEINVSNTDRAPVVTAPADTNGTENAAIAVAVLADDPDGEAITDLTADLSGLPAGHNANFIAAGDKRSGTLTWTPTFDDSGSHAVTITASNALNGNSVVTIQIGNVDRAPIVSAPLTVVGREDSILTVAVTAVDPDGDAILGLTADLGVLPAGHNATFVPGAGNLSGTFSWTPDFLSARVNPYNMTFTAFNALSGFATTGITVNETNRDPVVTAPDTAYAIENNELTVNVTAVDTDVEAITSLTADFSGLPLGHNASFSAAPDNMSGTMTWTPAFVDSGFHQVSFIAVSSTAGTTSTVVHVANLDRAPMIAVQDTISVIENNLLTLNVLASDPDGDPISSLVADLSVLPAGHDAVFTAAPDNHSGTLTWTPLTGDFALYNMVFTATNVLVGEDSTEISVHPPITPPGPPTSLAGTLVLPVTSSLFLPMTEGSGQQTDDQSGNGNHARLGTGTGADASDPAWVAGHTNNALDFDGTNDFIEVPHDATLTPASSFTIEAWVQIQGGSGQTIVNKGMSGQRTYRIRVTPTGGVAFRWETGALRNEVVAAAGTMPTGVWSHLACVFDDAAGENRIYVDGSLVATGGASGTPFANSEPLTIGARYSGASTKDYFGGLIDDFRLSPEALYDANFTPSFRSPVVEATIQGIEGMSEPGHTAVFAEGATVELTWNPPVTGGGFQAYNVYRSITGGPFVQINGAPVFATTFTDTSVVEGVLCYQVTALSDELITIEGVPSIPVCVEFIPAGENAPLVTVAPTTIGTENNLITVNVTAGDADGDAITSLTADLTNLPAGNDAVFTPGAGNTTGVFTWTPAFNHAGGPYNVTFTAGNALIGLATTSITVNNNDRAPVVVAPAAENGTETSLVTVNVTASDIDGEPITGLTADFSNLPNGHDAAFTPGAGNTTGVFTWTPTLNDAPGPYDVIFTASNASSGHDTTRITLANVDQAPVVASPDTVAAAEGTLLTLNITASDPDGDAIASLGADLGSLPAGNDAAFSTGAGNLTGTLTWTPVTGDSGNVFPVLFTASNTLPGMKTTYIKVGGPDQPPVVTVQATASVDEASQLTINVTAADGDGDPITSLTADFSNLPVGHNAAFTPGLGNTTGVLTWTPTLDDAPGPYVVNFTAANTISGFAATSITVVDVPVLPPNAPLNLVADLVVPVTSALDLPMDEGTGQQTDDQSGNGNHARLGASGGADPADPAWVPGHTGTALSFDGVNDFAEVAHDASLTPAGSFTLELYLRRLAGGGETVVNKGQSGQRTYRLRVSAGGAVKFRWETGAVRNELNTAAGAIPDNQWHHVAVVFDAAAGLNRIFVDGIQVLTGSASGTPFANSDPLTIGGRYSGTTTKDFFSGMMDKMRLSPEALYTSNFTPPAIVAGGPHLDASDDNVLNQAMLSGRRSNNAAGPIATPQTTPHSTPEAGGAFNAVLAGETVELSWDAPVGGGTFSGYNVYRSVTGGPYVQINGVIVTGTTFTDTAPVTGNLCYQVRAESDGAPGLEGPESNTACVQLIPDGENAPVVTAPATANVTETNLLTVNVTVNDADGDPITSLVADLSNLPLGHNAVFTAGGGNTSGTLTWTPTFDHAGSFDVTFTATNSLVGQATTTVIVDDNDRAPITTAPLNASTGETSQVLVNVTASDPDGDPIATLTADFSNLPTGHNANFTPGAGNTSGVFTWTPTLDDAPGPYVVTFTALNALQGQAATTIAVSNVDQAPTVSSPDTVLAAAGGLLTIHPTANDADGDPITSFTADLGNLPGGHDADFTAGTGNTTGVFTWTPTAADSGFVFAVTFTASNGPSGNKTTYIKVGGPDLPPTVTAAATAATNEGQQVVVNITANDGDGDPITSLTADLSSLPVGHDAQFTAHSGNTSGTLTWTPTFVDGTNNYAVTFTASNALSGNAATTITVTDVAPGAPQNLVANLVFPSAAAIDLPMNEGANQTAADATANGNDAQLGSTAGADVNDPAWVTGHSGSGLEFDGVNDLLIVNDDPTLTPAGAFTIELWLRRFASGGNTVVNKGQSGDRTYRLRVTAGGGVEFRWETGTIRNEIETPAGAIPDDQWHHVACVFDQAASTNRIFIDGVEVLTGPTTGVPVVNTDPVTIGGRFSGTTLKDHFGGLMDDFKITPEAVYTSNFTPPALVAGGPAVEAQIATDVIAGDGDLIQRGTVVTDVQSGGTSVFFDGPAVDLTWDAPASGGPVAGYNVYRTVDGGSAVKLNGALVLGTTYQDTTLVAGNLCYVVRAEGSAPTGIESADSNEECVVYAPALGDPTPSSATDEPQLVTQLELPQTFTVRFAPNPMRLNGVLSLTLTQSSPVRAELYDASGRRVQTISDGAWMQPGTHHLTVTGRGDQGRRLDSGVYFYRIHTKEGVLKGRVVLTR